MTDPIRFTLDGAEVSAAPDETIWQVARQQAGDMFDQLDKTCQTSTRGVGKRLVLEAALVAGGVIVGAVGVAAVIGSSIQHSIGTHLG